MNDKNLTCYETGWAVFLDIQMWIKWLGLLSNIATIAAVIVACVAAWITYQQIIANRQESRRSTASQIYQQYLNLCMNNSAFSLGYAIPTIRNDDYTKYCWFVSSMLYSFEEILDVNGSDEQWIKAIESQLERHKAHLKISSTVNDQQWGPELDNIIKKIIS